MTMRLFFIFIYISLIGCGTAQKSNDLTGEWIRVSTWEGSGLILDFRDNKELFIGAIGIDSTTKFNYTFDNKSKELTVDYKGVKEVFGKIEEIDNDRLVIVNDDSKKLEFVKIKSVIPELKKIEIIELLKNTAWALKQLDEDIRMDFLSIHRWDDNHQPFEAMYHYWFDAPYKEKEIWNVGEYNGKLFIFFTNHQTEEITYQILEVNPDKIVLVSHTPVNTNQVQVIERIKSRTQNSVDKICAKPWTSTQTDTIYCQERGQINIRDKDAKELQLLLKKIEFKINIDKSYSAKIDGEVWRTGQWKMTSDGAYIILDDERDKKNWLEIQQKNDHLIMTKLQQVKDGDRDYKLYFLTIRLE